MIFLGIEAEADDPLKEANKKMNLARGVKTYPQIFRTIQKHGIGVIAGFIFGWDSDTPETIMNRARFAVTCGADSFQTSVLTPLPGTQLFQKIIAENRLLYKDFPNDWTRYDYFEPTITHPLLSTEELDTVIERAKRKIFSPVNILRRNILTYFKTRSVSTTIILTLNYWYYRKIFLKGKWKGNGNT
jgi:radical SAM superfamily enzyme YgiQ (UPF0313 family)